MQKIRQTLSTRKGKVIFAGLSFMMLLGLGASAIASRMQHFPGPWMVKRIVKQLKLDNTQKGQLRGIFKEARKDMKQNRAKMKSIKDQVKTLMSKANPSQTELDALVTKGFDTAKGIALSKTKYFLQARKVLTPKQRAKIKTLMKRMKKFHKKRHSKFKKRFEDPNFVPSFLK